MEERRDADGGPPPLDQVCLTAHDSPAGEGVRGGQEQPEVWRTGGQEERAWTENITHSSRLRAAALSTSSLITSGLEDPSTSSTPTARREAPPSRFLSPVDAS